MVYFVMMYQLTETCQCWDFYDNAPAWSKFYSQFPRLASMFSKRLTMRWISKGLMLMFCTLPWTSWMTQMSSFFQGNAQNRGIYPCNHLKETRYRAKKCNEVSWTFPHQRYSIWIKPCEFASTRSVALVKVNGICQRHHEPYQVPGHFSHKNGCLCHDIDTCPQADLPAIQ